MILEALLTSTVAVAIAEIGDKTQLLAFLLATRFKRPLPIIMGIFIATIANHAAAAWLGDWAASLVSGQVLTWIVGLSFIAVAIWILIPDKADDENSRLYQYGPFVASLVLFFIAEIGDKTQVATVLLAAKYDDLLMVVVGTTIGMLLANVPVVYAGQFSAERLPLKWIRLITCVLFAAIGIATLVWN